MTEEARTVAARRLRPWGYRLLAIESPVDEEKRASGLIVTIATPASEVVRAVVTAVGPDVDAKVDPGHVIYFEKKNACQVLDSWVVDPDSILALEEDD